MPLGKELSNDLLQNLKVSHVPKSTVRNVILKFKQIKLVVNIVGRGRKRKINDRLVITLVRNVNNNPHNTIKDLILELASSGKNVVQSTVLRCLNRGGLRGYRPRKTLLLMPRHLKVGIYFENEYLGKETALWTKILWFDEIKLERFGHNSKNHVYQKNGQSYDIKNTVPTVNHGRGRIMLWGYLSTRGTGQLVSINGIMKKEYNLQIISNHMKSST